MQATKVNERIVREGVGGFLNPPTHPEHTYSVETDLNRHRDNRGSMALSSAIASDYVDESAKQQAKNLLAEWEANKPALSEWECQLWIKRVMGYFRNCYNLADYLGERGWHADQLHICAPFPKPVAYNAFGAPIYGLRNGGTTYRQPSALGATYCNGGHSMDRHAGVHFIRKFYPEYEPTATDHSASCADCGHHVNAHANGDGGPCTVILAESPRTLCNCARFQV